MEQSIETWFGNVQTTEDALRIFQLCREGRLGRVRRRLKEDERRQIRSGSVFVFDEEESKIRRWTDGRQWSPSRIHGDFLIYRELERKVSMSNMLLTTSAQCNAPLNHEPGKNVDDSAAETSMLKRARDPSSQRKGAALKSKRPRPRTRYVLSSRIEEDPLPPSETLAKIAKKHQRRAQHTNNSAQPVSLIPSNHEQAKVKGSGHGLCFFKKEGLVKKTVSVDFGSRTFHLVAYLSKQDWINGYSGEAMQYLTNELRKFPVPTGMQLHIKKASNNAHKTNVHLGQQGHSPIQIPSDPPSLPSPLVLSNTTGHVPFGQESFLYPDAHANGMGMPLAFPLMQSSPNPPDAMQSFLPHFPWAGIPPGPGQRSFSYPGIPEGLVAVPGYPYFWNEPALPSDASSSLEEHACEMSQSTDALDALLADMSKTGEASSEPTPALPSPTERRRCSSMPDLLDQFISQDLIKSPVSSAEAPDAHP